MRFPVLAVGEVLWDLLPSGPLMGGAPANFAVHAHALGADVTLVSRVGNDALGEEILQRFTAEGLRTDLIEVDSSAPTGSVSVHLGAGGEPRYTIHEQVAWDFLEPDGAGLAAAKAAAAICFGTLAQRHACSRRAIQTLVAATPGLRVLDINLRAPFVSFPIIEESLALANVLKLNENELPALADHFGLGGSEREMVGALAARFDLRTVVLTRGALGSLILDQGAISEHPGFSAEVSDTIGAGDSFTAACVLGLLHQWPLEVINERANRIAAYVCSHPGATPKLPAPLVADFLGR